mmetsp:Transcript_41953/g.110743  ORF Transcript_41953/g.110743 Transcript_41953/m.110743 type:complete len:125 (+) Transcript_41953:387-761(+)
MRDTLLSGFVPVSAAPLELQQSRRSLKSLQYLATRRPCVNLRTPSNKNGSRFAFRMDGVVEADEAFGAAAPGGAAREELAGLVEASKAPRRAAAARPLAADDGRPLLLPRLAALPAADEEPPPA